MNECDKSIARKNIYGSILRGEIVIFELDIQVSNMTREYGKIHRNVI
jgi:hypothetical protein